MGASTIAQMNGYLESFESTFRFNMMDMTLGRLPGVILNTLFAIFVLPRFCPDKPSIEFRDDMGREVKKSTLSKPKEIIAYIISLAMVVLMILANTLGIQVYTVAIVGATALVLCGILGRIGNEVYNGQHSEVNELSEGFKPGKVGSSTMPHKRNPFIPGEVVSYARLSRSVMMDALASMEGTNERDVRTIGLENEFLARGCCLADACVSRALVLMEDLEIHSQGIRRNLDLLGGLVYAEALMMRLSADYGRLEAHELIYELAQMSISENRNFREVLLADPRVGSKLTAADLDEIMNPAHYTGLSQYFTEAIAGKDR